MYYLTNGGILMYVILVMSIIGLGAVIERFIFFKKTEVEARKSLGKELKKVIESGEVIEVLKKLKVERSAVSRVLFAILVDYYQNPNSTVEKLEEKGKERALLEITQLEKNMWLISLVAHLTPFIGLLGTVTGMIKAFQAVAIYGTGDASVLAKGISEALFTTAGGLFVAIPALIFYNYFNKKIDMIISDIEFSSTELINIFRK
ncbi:colicin uptake protein TolQ [Fusobacterium necrogenes]|uniref:Colicin uptake protein TolQ n=1 Tax=Fusobacterium necrogenes TaxID=858 RepID=A0A377GWA4_9FUSO|nr:MotA/TolQ/ExbB proton channel family protein [Fusobacterium necrogenes]STO31239.1 colicin uptake protein TolQ [Fusobacterium necrogenes]